MPPGTENALLPASHSLFTAQYRAHYLINLDFSLSTYPPTTTRGNGWSRYLPACKSKSRARLGEDPTRDLNPPILARRTDRLRAPLQPN